MSKLTKALNFIKQYLITDYKKLLIRIVIALVCYFIFMLIDRTTKSLIFTSNNYHEGFIRINWGLIGFRPVLNNGAAFSSFLGRYSFLQTIAFIVCIATILLIFTKLELKFLIPLIFIGAGSLGNAIDRFLYDGYVRDMLYFPWWQRYATFNFADSFIIVDSIVLLVFVIINLFKNTEIGRTGKVA